MWGSCAGHSAGKSQDSESKDRYPEDTRFDVCKLSRWKFLFNRRQGATQQMRTWSSSLLLLTPQMGQVPIFPQIGKGLDSTIY